MSSAEIFTQSDIKAWIWYCFNCRLYSQYYHVFGAVHHSFNATPDHFHKMVVMGLRLYNDCLLNRTLRSCVYDERITKKIQVSGVTKPNAFKLNNRTAYTSQSTHPKIWQHYENTPIQIYCKSYHQKDEYFQIKILIFFHISALNIDYGYSLEPPRRGGSNEYPQSMFLSRKIKN